eukprot:jgi/Mesvir1/6252/Mv00971-RA.1
MGHGVMKWGNLEMLQLTANQRSLDDLTKKRDTTREEIRTKEWDYHQKFHPVWGQLLKTGYQNSRFAHQLERFACLYTSQVGNLLFYSLERNWQSQADVMPHEVPQ